MLTDSTNILIPISGLIKETEKCNKQILATKYNDILSCTAKYECDDTFVDTIQRMEIGDISVGYMSDE